MVIPSARGVKLSTLSTLSRFLLFSWLVLVFFGTIDLVHFLATGQWQMLILWGVIANCILGLRLAMKRFGLRGITLSELLGVFGVSLILGATLALCLVYL